MPLRALSYLKFLLRSTNQYGLHSPFVYAYVTRCLYRGPRQDRDRALDVLLKSLVYFGAKNIFLGDRPALGERIRGVEPRARFDQGPWDLLFFDLLDPGEFNRLYQGGSLHNDSLLLIDKIHGDARRLDSWNRLVALPQIRVSMDLYHCGLLLIRKEQQKEHFFIRI